MGPKFGNLVPERRNSFGSKKAVYDAALDDSRENLPSLQLTVGDADGEVPTGGLQLRQAGEHGSPRATWRSVLHIREAEELKATLAPDGTRRLEQDGFDVNGGRRRPIDRAGAIESIHPPSRVRTAVPPYQSKQIVHVPAHRRTPIQSHD
jgi:hypothetical protein